MSISHCSASNKFSVPENTANCILLNSETVHDFYSSVNPDVKSPSSFVDFPLCFAVTSLIQYFLHSGYPKKAWYRYDLSIFPYLNWFKRSSEQMEGIQDSKENYREGNI